MLAFQFLFSDLWYKHWPQFQTVLTSVLELTVMDTVTVMEVLNVPGKQELVLVENVMSDMEEGTVV